VRVGDTVRRPISPNAPFVHELLRHLELRGFSGAPRYLGQDEQGREILSFIPGVVPAELGEVSDPQCVAAARLLRAFHDATMDCDLRGSSEVICHGDASPCNFVFVDGVPWALIDFDAAHPGSRAEDLGYAAWLWLDFGNDELSAESQGRRLFDFAMAYDQAGTWEVPQLVLAAQVRLSESPDCPPGTKEWAQACHDWTRENLTNLGASYELRRRRQ
jgi:hypothetical protein